MKYQNPARSIRSAALYATACESIPAGVNSTARATWSGWDPYPLFVDHGEGAHLYRCRRQRVHRLPARPWADDSRPSPAEGDAPRSSSRSKIAARYSPLPTAQEAMLGGEDHRGGAERRSGAPLQYRHGGGHLQPAPRPRLHGPGKDHSLRGHVSRLFRCGLLEQASADRRGGPDHRPIAVPQGPGLSRAAGRAIDHPAVERCRGSAQTRSRATATPSRPY